MLKQKLTGSVQEVILPDFPDDDDNTVTTTVTKSRRVSFGPNFVKEFIVDSAISAQCMAEYEQPFPSSDSSNADSTHSHGTFVLQENVKVHKTDSDTTDNRPKPPKFASTICFSADSPTADMEFTEGCITLAKSILDKKNKEMTVFIQAKPKGPKEEEKTKEEETNYFEGSQFEMSMTQCLKPKEKKREEKRFEKTKMFAKYEDEMSMTRCERFFEDEDESKENRMPLDAIMRYLDKDESDSDLFNPEKSFTQLLGVNNSVEVSDESEQLNLNESMEISGDLNIPVGRKWTEMPSGGLSENERVRRLSFYEKMEATEQQERSEETNSGCLDVSEHPIRFSEEASSEEMAVEEMTYEEAVSERLIAEGIRSEEDVSEKMVVEEMIVEKMVLQKVITEEMMVVEEMSAKKKIRTEEMLVKTPEKMITEEMVCEKIVDEDMIDDRITEEIVSENMLSDEKILSETRTEDILAEEMPSTEETLTEETTPKKTRNGILAGKMTPEKITPEKMIAREKIPEKILSEKILTEEITAEKTRTEEMIDEEMACENITAENMISEKMVSQRVTPEEMTAEKMVTHEKTLEKMPSEKIITEEIIAEKMVNQEKTPEKIPSETLIPEETEGTNTGTEKMGGGEMLGERIAPEKMAAEEMVTEKIAEEVVAEKMPSEKMIPEEPPAMETRTEILAEKITPEKMIPEEIVAEEIMVEKMPAQDKIHKKMPSQKMVTPEKTPEKMPPETLTPEERATKKTRTEILPEKKTPEKMAPKEMAFEKITAEETTPEDTITEDLMDVEPTWNPPPFVPKTTPAVSQHFIPQEDDSPREPSLGDLKVIESLKEQAKEKGCVWSLRDVQHPQKRSQGSISFTCRLLDSTTSLRFSLKVSGEDAIDSCSLVTDSSILLDEEQRCRLPEYTLAVGFGFDELKKDFGALQGVSTLRHVPYYMDRVNSYLSKMNGYLRQIHDILSSYPGSRLNGCRLSFRLFSFPMFCSCVVSIDLSNVFLLSRASLLFSHDFGCLDERKVGEIFEESLKGENSLCEFVVRCTRYLVEQERQSGYLSKRKHIRLLPDDLKS